MKLYGIASRLSRDVDEWHASREEAQRVLAEMIADEPGLIDELFVEELELETGENGSHATPHRTPGTQQ
jgi:hypothetical protein